MTKPIEVIHSTRSCEDSPSTANVLSTVATNPVTTIAMPAALETISITTPENGTAGNDLIEA